MDIKIGDWVLYKGTKAYVCGIQGTDIWLSGWHGIKTKVVPAERCEKTAPPKRASMV